MTTPASKPKVAFYWCSSCGGCEEAVVDLNSAILQVVDAVDIVLWPVALDFKYHHVEELADGEIAVSFVNGAIRTDENAEIARLLRKKSGLVVAFGSCAHTGGIPGLANLTTRGKVFERSYESSPTVVNPERTTPRTHSEVDGFEAELPEIWEHVYTLDQVVDVDYYLPGCPPVPDLIEAAVKAILSGNLPAKGTVLAPEKALCDECPRRESKTEDCRISRIYRPWEIQADPDVCFLEQGIICCGPATRSGCGHSCIEGNMPCTGCFGPTPDVVDQGGKMLSALSSLLDADTPEALQALAEQLVDAAGSFYRYAVPASLLAGRPLDQE